MRQFILAKKFVENFNIGTAAIGDLGLVFVRDIVEQSPAAGNGENKHANFVLKTKDGLINFPIYSKNLTGSIMRYYEGKSFMAAFTVGEVNPYLDYTVTFVKKGKQFNERNKWTAVIHSKATDTPETIAEAIVKFVLDNPSLGLAAQCEGANVMVSCFLNDYQDYTITFGDELYGTKLAELRQAEPELGGAAHVRDLFEKCAADRGFAYTGEDLELYPGYKVNIEEGEYSIMTLRFTEPRVMGTREEEVYQIIQIAMPNHESGEDMFRKLIGAINDTLDIKIFSEQVDV